MMVHPLCTPIAKKPNYFMYHHVYEDHYKNFTTYFVSKATMMECNLLGMLAVALASTMHDSMVWMFN